MTFAPMSRRLETERRLHSRRERNRTDVSGYCGFVVGRSTPEEPELDDAGEIVWCTRDLAG